MALKKTWYLREFDFKTNDQALAIAQNNCHGEKINMLQ